MNSDIPISGLLSRCADFLPVMAKANDDLNAQIAKEGAEAVRIDDGMLAVDEENEPKEDKNEEEIENISSPNDTSLIKRQKLDAESENEEVSSGDKPATIQLEFMLGDFDGSHVANAEEQIKQDELATNEQDSKNDEVEE